MNGPDPTLWTEVAVGASQVEAAALFGEDLSDAVVMTYDDFLDGDRVAGRLASSTTAYVAWGDRAPDVVRRIADAWAELPGLRLVVELPAGDRSALTAALESSGAGVSGVLVRGGRACLVLDGAGGRLTAEGAIAAVIARPAGPDEGETAELLARIADTEEELRARTEDLVTAKEAAAGERRRNRRLRAEVERLEGSPEQVAPTSESRPTTRQRAVVAGVAAFVLVAVVVVGVVGAGVARVVLAVLAGAALVAVADVWQTARSLGRHAGAQTEGLATIEESVTAMRGRIRDLDEQQRNQGEAVDGLAVEIRNATSAHERGLREITGSIHLLGTDSDA